MVEASPGVSDARAANVRHDVVLPRRRLLYPSPVDWRDEVLYFLLVDRFSDGGESGRRLLDRSDVPAARPDGWRWDLWARSGGGRWQGGSLQGVISKLGYLQQLGVTTLWISPVFKQRGHLDTFHGYAIQDFLDIDPRVGTRADLVEVVARAHASGMRVILDVVFQHSGPNWEYPPDTPGGPDMPAYTTGRYPFGSWRGEHGELVTVIADPDQGVWPVEFQRADVYTRAGAGDLGAGAIDDPNAEHKRSDFLTLRDIDLDAPGALSDIARCFKYWIALTDCDGFRIDTLKHVSLEQARNFCGTIKEFAANVGKENFFLAGEIAGGDYAADRYLDVLDRNLNAALDIGEMRPVLTAVAQGRFPASSYFDGFDPGRAVVGSHRNVGNRHVSILDDHDHVFGTKLRFTTTANSPQHVVGAVALQLFTLGIPCIYYGTEQAFAGPEPAEQRWLPDWGSSDRYLREAMFGPAHPRASGLQGIDGTIDPALPGFGPFGTSGHHCFDPDNATYQRIAMLTALRRDLPVLRHGRQYQRPISNFGQPFAMAGPGELIAWSRILDDEEALCIVNPHGTDSRGGDVLVDAELSGSGATMRVALQTDPARPIGPDVVVDSRDGNAYVAIRDLAPADVLVLTNHAAS